MDRIKDIFRYIERKQRFLTPYQFNFVRKVKSQFERMGRISPVHVQFLESITSHLPAEG